MLLMTKGYHQKENNTNRSRMRRKCTRDLFYSITSYNAAMAWGDSPVA